MAETETYESLCAACGNACNVIAGAQATHWTLHPTRHTLTGTVHLSEYDAIAMGTETQALVVAVLRRDLLQEVTHTSPCVQPPCPVRRAQDRQTNHGCVQYPAGYDTRG